MWLPEVLLEVKLNPQSQPPKESQLSGAWTIPLGVAHARIRLNTTNLRVKRKQPEKFIFGWQGSCNHQRVGIE